jgi:threonine synthase
LFELNGRDGGITAEQMQQFRHTGATRLEADQHDALRRRFRGHRVDDVGTVNIMRNVYQTTGMLLDPHTAVGVGAARACRTQGDVGPDVILATAHPAKFPDAVRQATGVHPALPAHLADLLSRPEHTHLLPNDLAAVQLYVSHAFD